MALGVKVKMVTGDQLAIAKETGRRLGLGDHMYSSKVLKEGPEAGGKHATLDEMIMDADGFAGVFPEHKFEIVKRIQGLGHLCAMTGDGANDAPALSRANVGIAVEGATDAARGAADIVLTEPGLSTIVHAIYGSRVIFQRMRNYAVYACAVTIRIVVCFAIMAFGWQFDFPSFMVLIIAVLNDGTIMTLSLDRVLPSTTPDEWNLAEVFAYGIGYGLYLTGSTLALFATMRHTDFFERRFGVNPIAKDDVNDSQGHMVIYLQVAIISQALIFVTRSHGPSWTERPSVALMVAFCLAQLVSSIIAGFGDWGFTDVHSISGGWIGIVWVWNIVWYFPMDLVKYAMKKSIIKYLQDRRKRGQPPALVDEHGERLQRTASRHESLYSNRTNFLARAANRLKGGQKVSMSRNELSRFSSIQAQQSGAALQRASSRAA
jgi:H+-transporting ATPase